MSTCFAGFEDCNKQADFGGSGLFEIVERWKSIVAMFDVLKTGSVKVFRMLRISRMIFIF